MEPKRTGAGDGSKAAYDRLNVQRWRQIAAAAERQGGHITHPQLVAAGLTRHAIANLIDRGSLIRVHHAVYAVGHLPTTPFDRAHAALLAAGPRSALSHGTAMTLWELWRRWEQPFEVTIATDRRPPGLEVHHSRTLRTADVRVVRGLRVTSPARTVLDMAPRLNDKQLARALNDMRLRHKMSLAEQQQQLDRNQSRAGTGRIRKLLGASHTQPTRSTLEDDWTRFARRHRLPKHEMNVHVCGHRVDVLFAPDALILELDGWEAHQTKQAFEHDRRQDAEILERRGIPTIRLSHDEFHAAPAANARRIRQILQSRW